MNVLVSSVATRSFKFNPKQDIKVNHKTLEESWNTHNWKIVKATTGMMIPF